MAPATSSRSSKRPTSSRHYQTTSPRRSARLQKTSSESGALKRAFDRPETRETAESTPIDPPTEKDAGHKRKRNEDIDQAVECSSVTPKEQGIDRKRKRSEDTERPVEPIRCPSQYTSSVKSQELEVREREAGEQDAGEQETSQNPRRSPTLEPDDEAAPQSHFTSTWYEARNPVDHWVKHDVWPPSFAESYDPPSEEMSQRTPSVRRRAREAFHKEVWDINLPQAEINAPNASDTRARLLKNKHVIGYFNRHSSELEGGLSASAKETCRQVLASSRTGSSHTTEYYHRVLQRTKGKNETKVVQDIGPLVAPRVEPFYYDGDESLKKMTESVDETWSTCVPLLGYNPPKPDYAAGFHYETAFTQKQRSVLERFSNSEGDSLVQVTMTLCFPFLSFEAKSGDGSRPEAERQNVEDALIGSRGVIELFKAANLAEEIHLEIITFSVVYDDEVVRLYGHFADVHGEHPQFYRHLIKSYVLDEVESASYNMIRYIYKVWAQDHWKRICRAIDTLAMMPPKALFSVSGNWMPQSGSMGPPPEPKSASMPPPAPRPTSASNVRSQGELTPNTSPARDTKKPKNSDYS